MKIKLITTIIALFTTTALFSQTLMFPPTPNEDSINGRNSNCYLAAIGHPTKQEREIYINELKPFIDSVCNLRAIPAKTILSMAILESGCGYTRIGYYGNNLFGMKQPKKDKSTPYILKGQPAEGDNVIIIKQLDEDRVFYDEINRTNNRYKKFNTKKECIMYLIDTFLQMDRYKIALTNYKKNINSNTNADEAALLFAFDIGECGYYHLKGKAYREKIEPIFKTLK